MTSAQQRAAAQRALMNRRSTVDLLGIAAGHPPGVAEKVDASFYAIFVLVPIALVGMWLFTVVCGWITGPPPKEYCGTSHGQAVYKDYCTIEDIADYGTYRQSLPDAP